MSAPETKQPQQIPPQASLETMVLNAKEALDGVLAAMRNTIYTLVSENQALKAENTKLKAKGGKV